MTDQAAIQRDWIIKFILHVATGALAVAVHYGLMAFALVFGTPPLWATSIGFLGGAITRFFTAYFHVFSPSQTVRFALPKFIVALSGQLIANYLLVAALTAISLGLWTAQVLTTLLLTLINYLVYRLWVFR